MSSRDLMWGDKRNDSVESEASEKCRIRISRGTSNHLSHFTRAAMDQGELDVDVFFFLNFREALP